MCTKIVFTQEQKDQIFELNKQGLSDTDIGIELGVSKSTIRRFLVEHGIVNRKSPLTKEREEQIIQSYLKHQNQSVVAKELHSTILTVYKTLVKYNIPIVPTRIVNQKYKIDENYFSQIDTHNKAYILGLLYADGCLASGRNAVILGLQERDINILEQIKEELKTDLPLHFKELSLKHPTYQNQYSLVITNKKIYDDLLLFGLMPNKSLILKFPDNISDEFYPSFLLGYEDGDGHVDGKRYRCNFVGTEAFCTRAAEIIKDTLDIHCSIMYCHNRIDKPTRLLQIAGFNQTKKYLDWIYSKSDLHIDRKYEVYKRVYCS